MAIKHNFNSTLCTETMQLPQGTCTQAVHVHKRKCLFAFCVCMCTIVFVNNCSEPVHSHALYRRTPCTQHFSIIFMTDDLQST